MGGTMQVFFVQQLHEFRVPQEPVEAERHQLAHGHDRVPAGQLQVGLAALIRA